MRSVFLKPGANPSIGAPQECGFTEECRRASLAKSTAERVGHGMTAPLLRPVGRASFQSKSRSPRRRPAGKLMEVRCWFTPRQGMFPTIKPCCFSGLGFPDGRPGVFRWHRHRGQNGMSDTRQLPSSPNYLETADCFKMKAVGRPRTLFSVPLRTRNSRP